MPDEETMILVAMYDEEDKPDEFGDPRLTVGDFATIDALRSRYHAQTPLPILVEALTHQFRSWDGILQAPLPSELTCLQRSSLLTIFHLIKLIPTAKLVSLEGCDSYFRFLEEVQWDELSFLHESVGPGYIILNYLPPPIAAYFGFFAATVAPHEKYENLNNGGIDRKHIKLKTLGSSTKPKYTVSRRAIFELQATLVTLQYLHDPCMWSLFSWNSRDQTAVSVLGSGHRKKKKSHTCHRARLPIAASNQSCHTDMNNRKMHGNNQFTETPEKGKRYPLCTILCLFGETCLTIAPGSWGCHCEYETEHLDLKPGQVMIFHGNFVHAGRRHSHVSWRLHWYLPLKVDIIDTNKTKLCDEPDY